MGCCVLIVDDDLAFQRRTGEVLASVGLGWRAVASAEEARGLLDRDPPQALIVGGLLPGQRGDAFVREVRARFTAEALPVIFATAFFRDSASRARLLEEGAQVVLYRPATAEALKRALLQFPALAAASAAAPPEGMEFDLRTSVELLDGFLLLAAQRVVELRAAVAALSGPDGAAAARVIRREGHRFKGTGAAYGMPELSRLGAQVQALVGERPALPFPVATRARLSGLVEAIAARLKQAGAAVAAGEEAGAGPRILLVDEQGPLARAVAAAGPPFALASDEASALAALRDAPAAAVVVATDRGFDGLGLVERLATSAAVPVLAVLASGALPARTEAVQRGAAATLSRPADAEGLWRVCAPFLRPPTTAPVVAASGDRALLRALAEALAEDARSVTPCLTAQALLTALEAGVACAVVLGPQTVPEPLTLARLLRADPRHTHLPLLVLGLGDERGARLQALEAGADEALAGPFDPEAFRARLQALCRRQPRAPPVLPGFDGPAELEEALAAALALGPRGHPVALLVFQPDPAALPREAFARAAMLARVGAALRGGVRATDVVAALEDACFAVLLHGSGAEDAQRLLRQHLEAVRASAEVELRTAWACFPGDAGTPRALLRHALDGLRRSSPGSP